MMEKSEPKFRLPKIIEFVRTWCAYIFLQYELITCTCMFEPWEKVFINSIVLIVFGLVSYSSWIYLSQYLMSVFKCFIQITRIFFAVFFDW